MSNSETEPAEVVVQVVSPTYGPTKTFYQFVDLAPGAAPVAEPRVKAGCWALTKARETKRPYQCLNYARSTGAGTFCTCKVHRAHEAAARKLKAELAKTK